MAPILFEMLKEKHRRSLAPILERTQFLVFLTSVVFQSEYLLPILSNRKKYYQTSSI